MHVGRAAIELGKRVTRHVPLQAHYIVYAC